MSITGKVVGAIIGLLLFRSPWGAIIGLILGHFYDQSASAVRRTGGGAGVLEIGERFFTATFEVMGHVAKSDGRVSEAEIAAARKVMAELRLDGAQIHAAIAHFTRGKNPDFDLESTMQRVRRCVSRIAPTSCACSSRCRCAPRSKAWTCRVRRSCAIQKVADLLDVSRIELAHMEAVLRIRREQFKAGAGRTGGAGGAGGQAPPRSSMQVQAAYQILEVDSKATNEEVAKAYRRQLAKHHPDKLKANGLPDSMLEHAKQRTQQIIEAYESIKSSRGA